jgi:hypothetical protein
METLKFLSVAAPMWGLFWVGCFLAIDRPEIGFPIAGSPVILGWLFEWMTN